MDTFTRVFFLLCLTLCLFSASSLAHQQRLRAHSFYNYELRKGDIRVIPSDSISYRYSGNRGGDWEGTLPQYDLSEYDILDIHSSPPTSSPDSKSLRTYTAQNKVLSDTAYGWNNGTHAWEPQSLTTFEYNAHSLPTKQWGYMWDGSSFAQDGRISYEYNAADSVTRWTEEQWLNGSWSPVLRMTYEFDTHGNVLRFVMEDGRSTGVWLVSYYQTWIYDVANRLVQEDDHYSTGIHREHHYYDVQNYLIAKSMVDSSTQVQLDSTAYVYSAHYDSLRINRHVEVVGLSNYSYTSDDEVFDAQHNIIWHTFYQYADGKSTPMQRETFEYDDKNRVTADSLFTISNNKVGIQQVITNRYDSFNKLAETVTYTADSLARLIPVAKSTTERTLNGQLKVVVDYLRDSLQTSWLVNTINNYYYESIVNAVDDAPIETSLLVYPNPAIDRVLIETRGDDILEKVCVQNMEGRCIEGVPMLVRGGTLSIDSSNLADGCYSVQALVNRILHIARFVKISR